MHIDRYSNRCGTLRRCNASAVNRLKEFRAFLKHSKANTGFTNEIFRRDFVGR